MNKKGQFVLVGLMISFLVLMFIIGILDSFKDIVIDARSPSKLDCTNTSISSGTKATCIIVDYAPFSYSGVGIAMGIATIGIWATLRTRKQ